MLEAIDQDVRRGNSGIRVEPCNSDRVVVIPRRARTIIVGMVVPVPYPEGQENPERS